MSEVYDEEYFLRGRESGKSLYENYRWMPELTIPMVKRIAEHCGIRRVQESVLDFGCARGYIVKAFRKLGYLAFGTDVSDWALMNCDLAVEGMIGPPSAMLHDGKGSGIGSLGKAEYDWIIAKDVLEHVPDVQETIDKLCEHARKGIFAVVPLSWLDGAPYMVDDYEKDVTHIHRLCLASWAKMFMRPGWSVEARYLLPGVKDNYAEWARGNGFITARRV